MQETILVRYPIGGDSGLTGQTKQALNSEFYRLQALGILGTIRQEYIHAEGAKGGGIYLHGTYFLTLSIRTQESSDRIRAEVEQLLLFHPGSSLE